MTIGERIKMARKQKGLTQAELGLAVGVQEITIRKYELGKRQPRIEKLQDIADVLGVSLNSLLTSTESEDTPEGDLVGILNLSGISDAIKLPSDTIKTVSKIIGYDGYRICQAEDQEGLELRHGKRSAPLSGPDLTGLIVAVVGSAWDAADRYLTELEAKAKTESQPLDEGHEK